MPRQARMVAVGYPHHVTNRGNNREPVFFDDHDRLTYLEFLEYYTRQYQAEIWAYCLMPNHVHLVAIPKTSNALSRGIGYTNQVYTQHINRKYYRSGRIWQNRFFSSIVDTDEHLWAVARYVENNPVKAGLAEAAQEYRWSSARHHLEGRPDDLLPQPGWLQENERGDYRSFITEEDGRTAEIIGKATRSGQPFCGPATLEKLSRQFTKAGHPKLSAPLR